MEIVLLVVTIISISTGVAVTSATPNIILCHSCYLASSLADCGSMVQCDTQSEECYTDEYITDAGVFFYNAGCRGKGICLALVGRRFLYSCAQCCNSTDGCNDRLCGIPGPTSTTHLPTTSTQVTSAPTTLPPTTSTQVTSVQTTLPPTTSTQVTSTQTSLPPTTPTLARSCHFCNSVRSFAECSAASIQCDFQTEECFTDQIVTANMDALFNAGCRPKSLCDAQGKKRDLVSCSSCCNQTDHCNGDLCNFKTSADNSCQSHPCQNGGVCEKLPGTFHCHCAAGYMGRVCDLDFDECQYQTCYNGGTCVNVFGSFNCSCPSGFLGHKCETHADCSSIDAMPCWQLYSLRKCSRTHTIADACMKTKCDRCKVEFGQVLVG